jgi:hypothetical protein
LAVVLVLPASAGAQTAAIFGTSGASGKAITEVNVTNDPARDNGQPEVAVNPKDRRHVARAPFPLQVGPTSRRVADLVSLMVKTAC